MTNYLNTFCPYLSFRYSLSTQDPEMSETSSKEYNAGWGQTLASLIQIGIGIAMLVIGEKNL